MAVTDGSLGVALSFLQFRGWQMEKPSVIRAVYKLSVAGEQAGFSLEQMILLLNAGVSVETLLHLIEYRLNAAGHSPDRSSRWIM